MGDQEGWISSRVAWDASPEGFSIQTDEGKDEIHLPADMELHAYYEIAGDFGVTSAALADTYWTTHRRMEREGKIHHCAQNCPDRAIGSRVRMTLRQTGWYKGLQPNEKPRASPGQ
jgi:hypothetical protein